MLVTTKYGNVEWDEQVWDRLGELTGTMQKTALLVVAARTIERLVELPDADEPPLLQDAEVFLAQVLLSTPGDVQFKPELLTLLLKAWQAAEGSLKPDARTAMRLTDKMVQQVMRSSGRQEYIAWCQDKTKRMTDAQGMYVRMYLETLVDWVKEGEAGVEGEPHYIVRLLEGVFQRHLRSDVAVRKGKAYCQRRLQVAKAAIDEHLFQ